jgi:hypothetical protein
MINQKSMIKPKEYDIDPSNIGGVGAGLKMFVCNASADWL